ncbi:hypothetical protein FIBSPDRAFT_539488 [Athelia psychrophila]|uniref:Uncharacterized protein n=1 Tax=Athelia psychrophila TaxID=1759441 RepID=A0A166J353_9AGAM|nr:hypothetical protein FIBSPDRAFT_539488 [Fibularhizoctonia sp. CBS 109695]
MPRRNASRLFSPTTRIGNRPLDVPLALVLNGTPAPTLPMHPGANSCIIPRPKSGLTCRRPMCCTAPQCSWAFAFVHVSNPSKRNHDITTSAPSLSSYTEVPAVLSPHKL